MQSPQRSPSLHAVEMEQIPSERGLVAPVSENSHAPRNPPPPTAPISTSANDGLKRMLSARTAPSVAGGGHSLKNTVSRAASHLQAAHGIKDPWGLKWRSHPIFLTGVVLVGVCSDILAYVRSCALAISNKLTQPDDRGTSPAVPPRGSWV